MSLVDGVLFEGDTEHGHYLVVDTVYAGRPARVLYSGHYRAAQSGIARDGNPELLFDYNQRFMELINGLSPKRVLLIGGGAFTLPKAINEFHPEITLDVVELDGGLLPLAKKYFGFAPNQHTHIYTGDGREFLDRSAEPYDLVIIDAFKDTAIPPSLQTTAAAAALKRNLAAEGAVAVNVIATYYGERAAALKRQIAALQSTFLSLQLFPADRLQSRWLPQNFILTATNSNKNFEPLLRYPPHALPETPQ